jgi:hypothetical protein
MAHPVCNRLSRLIGYDVTDHYDWCPPRGPEPGVSYVFLADDAILKIIGAIPAPAPRIRGAIAWALRGGRRQATIHLDGQITFEEG